MTNVSVTDLEATGNGKLSFLIKDAENSVSIHFTMPHGHIPDNDLVGLSLTTLFGTKYSHVNLDFPISREMKQSIGDLTRAEIDAPTLRDYAIAPSGKKTALNFSGGFDSLAARSVLPSSTVLVSLDFGGSFQRERTFFDKFAPTIVETNFRAEGFANNSWSFMGVGPILLRDFLDIGSYSFGSILEASPYNFMERLRFRNTPNPWFKAAGLNQINPVLGLTEVGTAMLLLQFHPELISSSLQSLAAPGTEKMARKIILLRLAGESINRPLPSTPELVGGPFFKFGKSFATDFLSLYMLKKGGEKLAGQLVSDIPTEAIELAAHSTFDFYERINTNFYNHVPATSRSYIFSRCFEAGINLYDQSDWVEFANVRRLLARFHAFPA